jgi:hypothetical protein
MYASIRKVANLEGKFSALKNVAKNAKSFKLTDISRAPGSGTSADQIAHQQGICRLDGNGDFIISGCVKNIDSKSNDRPYFYVIKAFKGAKAVGGNDYYQIKNEDNPLCPKDVDNNDRRRFTHPGGIQVAENILAVGQEDYSDGWFTVKTDRSFIRFYDINNERQITEIKGWAWGRVNANHFTASAMGFTKSERYSQWVLAIREDEQLEVYTSLRGTAVGQSPLVPTGYIKFDSSNKLKSFQGIDLFWDSNDRLYLIGGPDGGSNNDELFLYELLYAVNPGSDAYISDITDVRYVDSVHFYRSGTGPRFKYGVGIYVNQNNQFEVYSIEMHVVDNEIRCNVWNENAT